jgi:hypothetical protein
LKFRKLRIAFSAVCGVVCLLLIALWVRSYWWNDTINSPTRGDHFFVAQSIRGYLDIGIAQTSDWTFRQGWILASLPLEKVSPPTFVKETGETNLSRIGWGWSFSANGFGVLLPHWVFPVLSAIIAAAPWFWPKQFTLRALLIAVTLISVLFGLVMWTSR